VKIRHFHDISLPDFGAHYFRESPGCTNLQHNAGCIIFNHLFRDESGVPLRGFPRLISFVGIPFFTKQLEGISGLASDLLVDARDVNRLRHND
jgi:hypothetical protein